METYRIKYGVPQITIRIECYKQADPKELKKNKQLSCSGNLKLWLGSETLIKRLDRLICF